MSTGIKIYYNVVTDTIYDSNGAMFGNAALTAYFNNHLDLEVNYMSDTSADSIDAWVPWTGLDGLSVSSSVSFDNDYIHANRGKTVGNTSGSTTLDVQVSIAEIDLNQADVLVIYNSDGTTTSVTYSSFIYGSSTISFILDEALTADVASGLKVRVPRSLFLKMQGDGVDNSSASTGKFTFHTYLMSSKILETLDYSNSKSLTGTMQHKIMSQGNVVRTFTFPFTIANLLDYNGQASIPATGNWASKEYVDSMIIHPTIGAPNYANAVQISSGFTATEFGWIIVAGNILTDGVSVEVLIDQCTVYYNSSSAQTAVIPIASNSTCTTQITGDLVDGTDSLVLKFVPCI